MQNPFVSFIVPVYNAAEYLERCVWSLQRQTFENIEIILVNDGSTDESQKICDALAQKDNRIVVVHQENAGVSVARNNGIELARGDYVAFVDADDWVDADVCERFAYAREKQDYDLFCFSAIYNSPKKSLRSLIFAEDIDLLSKKQKDELCCKMMTPWAPFYEHNCNTRFAGSACGKFYKLGILREKKLCFSKETVISEDCLFNIQSIDYFERIGYASKVFYHYEQQENSAQNRYRPNSMKYFEFVIDKIQLWLDENKKNQTVRDCANTLFIHYLFGSLKEDYFHRNNPNKDVACVELNKVLNQEKIQRILREAEMEYFSFSERVLIWLLQRRKLMCIKIVMKVYNLFM